MFWLILALGCIEERPPPYVGACADYPEGIYDFGEIGIGTCLSGPTSLDWVGTDGAAGNDVLLVTNSNPYRDYVGGSVVAVDVQEILSRAATDPDRIVVMDKQGVALSSIGIRTVTDAGESDASVPSYSAYVPDQAMLMVGNRLTPDARLRQGFDKLYMVDVSDPTALSRLEVSADGTDWIELMSDPLALTWDPSGGLVYVANYTSHTVSVLDPAARPVEVMDAVERARVTDPRFFDLDGSGSLVEVSTLDVSSSELVPNDMWTATYAEGSFRLWVADAEGVQRYTSQGAESWRASPFGVELTIVDDVGDPLALSDGQSFTTTEGAYELFFAMGGAVRVAVANGAELGDWSLQAPALSARSGAWDDVLGGPMAVTADGVNWLFFDGQNAETGESGIGVASSEQGVLFDREQSAAVLEAGASAHDAERIADPHVIFDSQADVWRMFYSAYDGATWSIGHATSADLVEWTADAEPVFQADLGVASPSVSYINGEFRMWSARWTDQGWFMGLATSPDGTRWTDRGVTLDLDSGDAEEPPGPGVETVEAATWGLYGQQAGALQWTSGDTGFGFTLDVTHGAVAGPGSAPTEGINGVRADAWVPDLGLVYVSMTDRQGQGHIGVGTWDGEQLQLQDEPVLSGQSGSFDSQGVRNPVVFASDGGWTMLFSGVDDEGLMRVSSATSADGLSWTARGAVSLDLGDEWDSFRVIPGAVVPDGDGFTLWYTGFDERRTRIGTATSTDGVSWTRAPGPVDPWIFDGGAPGDFDDSAVRHPHVLVVDGVTHLWYGAFDGDVWSVGYAWQDAGSAEWQRPLGMDGEPRPVLQGAANSFDAFGVDRALVQPTGDGFQALYSGWSNDLEVRRVGVASGVAEDSLYREPRVASVGDQLTFTSHAGDAGGDLEIPLERIIDGYALDGTGVSFLHADVDRGFLYVASKTNNHILVLDIRDDSTDTFDDANVFDIEAVLVSLTDSTSVGFRGLLAPPGSDKLYALNSAPDSVVVFDVDEAIVDDAIADVVLRAPVGHLVTPIGARDDQGAISMTDVGPSQLVVREDRMFVANFNANSLGVYDLRLGLDGQLVAELDDLGEHPHALSMSPDGTVLVVANHVGAVVDGHVSSSLVFIDVDPDSDTYLQVLARLVNE